MGFSVIPIGSEISIKLKQLEGRVSESKQSSSVAFSFNNIKILYDYNLNTKILSFFNNYLFINSRNLTTNCSQFFMLFWN